MGSLQTKLLKEYKYVLEKEEKGLRSKGNSYRLFLGRGISRFNVKLSKTSSI
jgi:hypothetical protein